MLLCIQSTTSLQYAQQSGGIYRTKEIPYETKNDMFYVSVSSAHSHYAVNDHNFITLLKADNKSRDFLSLRVTYRPSGAVGVNVTQRTTTSYVLRLKIRDFKNTINPYPANVDKMASSYQC